MVTFLLNDITLLFVLFTTLSKWKVQRVMLKCPVKSIQEKWTWIWQHFIMLLYVSWH